jgi:hypothetical protein
MYWSALGSVTRSRSSYRSSEKMRAYGPIGTHAERRLDSDDATVDLLPFEFGLKSSEIEGQLKN